jgi:hypothetical protein
MRKSRSNRSLVLPDIDPSLALVQALRSENHRAMFRQKPELGVASAGTRSMGAGKAVAGIRTRTVTFLLVLLTLLLGVTSALAQVVTCRPLLSTKSVREVRPSHSQLLPWRWHATIMADTGFCTTRSGNFEMDFIRIKDDAPDLQFTQTFRWTPNQFDISMELSPGEAILEFRIGFIAPCVCREAGQFSSNARAK